MRAWIWTWWPSSRTGRNIRSGNTSSPSPTAASRSAARRTDACWRRSRPGRLDTRRGLGGTGRSGFLNGRTLPNQLDERRDQVVRLLDANTGPLVHNPTRGQFLMPNAQRYGRSSDEWGAIYERFGVPAEIGLAQAILESGLDGRARSRARALGLCQWLSRNWQFLNGCRRR